MQKLTFLPQNTVVIHGIRHLVNSDHCLEMKIGFWPLSREKCYKNYSAQTLFDLTVSPTPTTLKHRKYQFYETL
jgi:hypothetical protein